MLLPRSSRILISIEGRTDSGMVADRPGSGLCSYRRGRVHFFQFRDDQPSPGAEGSEVDTVPCDRMRDGANKRSKQIARVRHESSPLLLSAAHCRICSAV